MRIRFIGLAAIALALIIIAVVFYRNSGRSVVPIVFSPTQVTGALWHDYTLTSLEAGTGRTLDKQRENITTSEGQSYTMLRAVWMSDKATFDKELTWTKNNMQHQTGDHLFAWLFGKLPNGSYGIEVNQGGNTTASDGDTDIALALVFAYSRWQYQPYLGDARVIINDIWDKEVVTINGVPYLAADNIEKTSNTNAIIVNPSYLNPAAYRVFARVDHDHPWSQLVDSSYAVIQKSAATNLDATSSASLPPDWVAIDKTTGAITAANRPDLTTNFGYDALRTPYHLALDYAWFADPRDKETLSKMSFLTQQWKQQGQLASVYTHAGNVEQPSQSAAMYGGTIGYFMLADPGDAKSVYENTLVYLFNPDTNTWKEELSYYDNNWAWFGIALYNNLLPNLTANVPDAALLK
jgi:endo-1,4-beta-D-glucanase Y